MTIPYHDESLVWTERHRQAALDRKPCPRCGGDRLRTDFTGSGECHAPQNPTADREGDR